MTKTVEMLKITHLTVQTEIELRINSNHYSRLTINVDESATASEIFLQFLIKTLLDKITTETNLYISQNPELSSLRRYDIEA